ncbi:cytochrome c biogenesis protein CcsA [Roseisolibacter sp. H3M3-2]|uniref:cytochrome c biogenesis protein CcsA n=1 Tax=Roseisolibacter sp. H3M3-2 TaxID=3031323 RepID=UPI0023DBBE9F|nr:cytochrome c biogenesis protein CcsA [Roseisolibacter sp. H3M3-2]MDF1503242.1 cytochrome c biogenesis protein CcsA [Roseisolibacter sp. H3M3-2]
MTTPDVALADDAPPRVDLLLVAALLALAGLVVRVVWFTPVEAMQGPAQKILYLHVPSAFTALYVGVPLLALCSGVYLWLRDARADLLAESAAEVSLVFMTVNLITGPIWGKPVWGTWWTWDARLTLTLFLWLVLAGYLVMRGAVDDRGLRARFSAVLGLLALLLVPFIHLSVYLFRTLHPQPVILKPSAPSMPPEMLRTLLFGFAAIALLFAALLRARWHIARQREALGALEEGA